MNDDILDENIQVTPSERPAEFVGSFEKGLAVIQVLANAEKGMTLAEVAEETGTSRASARRYLLTLQSLGYAELITKRFELTPQILELGGGRYDSGLTWQIAVPLMENLAASLGESCSAFIRDGAEVVCAAHVDADRFMAFRMPVGSRLPVLTTAAGRMILSEISDECIADVYEKSRPKRFTQFTRVDLDDILADIQDIRAQGYAVVDQELEIGLRTIAVPVRNKLGRIAGALNISADSSRVEMRTMIEDHLVPLNAAAASISGRTIGF